jgi:hypothetical protein
MYYKFDGRTTFQKIQKCEIITNVHDHIFDKNNKKKGLHLLTKTFLKATSGNIPNFLIIVIIRHHISFHICVHSVGGMNWVKH